MSSIVNAQRTWRKCIQWLTNEQVKTTSADSVKVFTQALKLLLPLPWNEDAGHCTTTLEFAQLLGTDWISGTLEDMMMDLLDRRAKLACQNALVGTSILAQLISASASANDFSPRNAPLLHRYEVQVISLGIRYLYLPVHVHGNHWIAVAVDFVDKTIRYGDSLEGSMPKPADFLKNLQRWLRTRFGSIFVHGKEHLEHGNQQDCYSCGIVTANTIAHAMFGDPLWQPEGRSKARAEWFVMLVKDCQYLCNDRYHQVKVASPSDEASIHVPTDTTLSGISSRHNASFAIGGHDLPLEEFALAVSLDNHNGQDDALITNGQSSALAQPTCIPSASESTTVSQKYSLAFVMHSTRTDDMIAAREIAEESRTGDGHPSKSTSTAVRTLNVHSDMASSQRSGLMGWLQGGEIRGKRGRSGSQLQLNSLSSDNVSGSDQASDRLKKSAVKRTKVAQDPKEVIGTSRSAEASRDLRVAAKSGQFRPNAEKSKKWKTKILALDEHAEFIDENCMVVRHSKCAEPITVKEPYDVSRFKKHCLNCRSERFAGMIPVSQWGQKLNVTMTRQENHGARQLQEASKHPPSFPCPGLSALDTPLIPVYLRRTPVGGGGSRSVVEISKEQFKKTFGELSKRKKQIVLDKQTHERAWRNDHQTLRVFSARCEKSVANIQPCSECSALLCLKNFRSAIKKPVPADKNYVHVNYRYRPEVLGRLFALNIGIREIVESAFATGVLQGKYKDLKVFTGLVEAMVSKLDRETRGVGLQNFSYSPAWDEFAHILKIHSPRAYRHMTRYLPARSERSFREKESRRPSFPMSVCARSFQLVADHLEAVSYNGPVALSCDDTKLHAAWRLYYDKEKDGHYLVGAVGEPYLVMDPEALRNIIDSAGLELATKLRLWCLHIPLPRSAPIIVSARPIAAENDAETLAKWSLDIIGGLRAHNIMVVSSASDGTEVERASQRIMEESAETTNIYEVESPGDGMAAIKIKVPITYGQALSHMQDSKHGLKTYRNNLFSGARLLTLGNYTAIYTRIRAIAFEDNTPLYHRDVEKLDRQDDNVAARLFSSKVLSFIISRHPDYVGEIIYLFVHGELIDAYQNRRISHTTRTDQDGFAGKKFSAYSPPTSRPELKDDDDLQELSMFPTDTEIQQVAKEAAGEAQGLLSLLGLNPMQVLQSVKPTTGSVILPGISSFNKVPSFGNGLSRSGLDSESDSDEESGSEFDGSDVPATEKEELESLVALANNESDVSVSNKMDDRFIQLTFAAIATNVSDMEAVNRLAHTLEDDDLLDEDLTAREFEHIQHCLDLAIPPFRGPDVPSKPCGVGTFGLQALDFSMLIEGRELHETSQAKNGCRTSGEQRSAYDSMGAQLPSVRGQLIREFRNILNEHQERAAGTGANRAIRWTGSVSQISETGNAGNAAAVSRESVRKAMVLRNQVFCTAKVPLLTTVASARISAIRPLIAGDFGIVWIKDPPCANQKLAKLRADQKDGLRVAQGKLS
ncbi:hypothetical protein PAXINDRAFT_157495 [Paxillus involutus ATCC 200175]|uniref:Ubiquitin-like protease family profile domain-containing protein n=1 Tax=Paxillus involutus ATCC 200175 TaxID=664439 RepID=A0A0C9SS14_PAXIN|nr:hypothetical protein PAXINDRAFT_157495 [Paxillus involutus ATCC 200175]